ncbi:hypothetical protein JZ751_026800 [Albula glossodonta]|uniref:Rab-GAP TBC domain-containing protein n=1 Tax=Albula glossodonta TaxID=121402 RepID=A0A8T2PLC4_9TELE|nr:hypothetical protein JZ751_026800 [Albula glossodonta]
MSLCQLLRQTPSDPSAPLILDTGSGRQMVEPNGEIIFSKNNVCVHPSESLQGQAQHHPGYLCIHLEKDEELGTTLNLTWVPNSRIQRQDEEALRYITPDGSPIRKNPRRSPHCSSARPPLVPQGLEGKENPVPEGLSPGPQQQEGSFECPVNFGSHKSAQDSALCLSPISEALVDSSASNLQENNNRETCDETVALSAISTSSLSQDCDAPTESSQSQVSRWEEQETELEPSCGVFRVDLGHMRSLRLFFSDEACSSGQLVIASRDNQFKILHFHHAGLDKLSEVFRQWKCCQETQLKDQVLDGRSCMQFSVLRPTLPSADTHPEERLYHRLDLPAWLRHLNHQGQVEDQTRLRKVWPYLLRYYRWDSTAAEREAWRLQKHSQYQEIQHSRLSMSPDEQSEFWRKVQFTVDRDVVRTDCTSPFFRGENNPNVESMRRILLNYAIFNPEMGYCQGMSDLLAPLLMLYLREMLRLMVPRFHQHLTQLGEDGLQLLFCHRWVLLCFRREFPDTEALRMWETCWAHYQTDYFHLFLCVAVIMLYGDDVTGQQLAMDQMLLHFSNLSMHMNGDLVLRKARSLLYQFSHLPTIPCSLHDLCTQSGPGMWDSDCVPAVECSGDHPDPQQCPYGSSPTTPHTPPSPQPTLSSKDKGDPETLRES